MTYIYNDKNQVTRITDAAVDPNGKRDIKDFKGFVYDFEVGAADNDHYIYDANGNLIADAHKGITNIEYNYLNLPQVITFTGSRSITFVYDAGGTKLQKITNDNGKTMTYDYVNGVEYENTILQRIAHTEGSISRQKDGVMAHEYVLRDHLGNTRVTFSDMDNDGTVTKDDIKQINHFYSFGLNMEGNWNGSSPDAKNKYQYNGKELQTDFDLNLEDYGARFYDPSIGRWNSVDPLANTTSNLNPYNYASNNPICRFDPDGKKDLPFDEKKDMPATVVVNSSTPTYIKIGFNSIKMRDRHQENPDAFNCHSFAWNSMFNSWDGDLNADFIQKPSGTWDENPQAKIRESGVIQLGGEEANKVGDRVIYYQDANNDGQYSPGEAIIHSAVVAEVDKDGNTTVVVAKKGAGNIVKNHPALPGYYDKMPEGGSPTQRAYFRIPDKKKESPKDKATEKQEIDKKQDKKKRSKN